MSQQDRNDLKALALSKIPGGTRTTASEMRDVINDIIDSVNNILDDKNQNNGYAGLNGSGKISLTIIPLGYGKRSFNGDGATIDFDIPHGLGAVPSSVNVTPITQDSADRHWIATVDGTIIRVRFAVAPSIGVNNVGFYFQAL